jgi:hypothetical protein
MATVRSDLVGTVLAVNATNQYQSLSAGDTIPDGYFVGGHAVQGGDPDDQIPSWAQPTPIVAADISDATTVGLALITAEDAAAGRAAIDAAEAV